MVVAELLEAPPDAAMGSRSSRESLSTLILGELAPCGPRESAARDMCIGFLGERLEARRGSWSIKYIRMKPAMRDMPIQACGSWCACASSASLRSKRDGSLLGSNCAGSVFGMSLIGSGCARFAELLYSVSMPSGIIMMRQVPTRRPVPIADIMREWFCDNPKLSGSDPAKNDLQFANVSRHYWAGCCSASLRQTHHRAEAQ